MGVKKKQLLNKKNRGGGISNVCIYLIQSVFFRMMGPGDNNTNFSMKLSAVLDEIGVNENIVMKRRRAYLLAETMKNITTVKQLTNFPTYIFGSQSEGTTTIGLHSDKDQLICRYDINVMQELSDWKPGAINLMMIEDDTVSPGYCLLQRWRGDVPLPLSKDQVQNPYMKDERGRHLLRNNLNEHVINIYQIKEHRTEGQAITTEWKKNWRALDVVPAIHCKTWPTKALQWLEKSTPSGWPSAKMKVFSKEHGCFLVPVSSKVGSHPESEWRISTSMAERCLMFNLNITQIRCFILMKMICKTKLILKFGKPISSYMCKTVIFHSIANTSLEEWQEKYLLKCLKFSFLKLYNFLQAGNLPHFIIPENNLIAGKFNYEINQRVMEAIHFIIYNTELILTEVRTDQLGNRLKVKLKIVPTPTHLTKSSDILTLITGELLHSVAFVVHQNHIEVSKTLTNISAGKAAFFMLKHIICLTKFFINGTKIEQVASKLLSKLAYSSLGSILAATCTEVSIFLPAAMMWLNAGIDSDVLSSRLKLASVYCGHGNFEKSRQTLQDAKQRYVESKTIVKAICACKKNDVQITSGDFFKYSSQGNEEIAFKCTAFCVTFLKCESKHIPKELGYEFFRSTSIDMKYRTKELDDWMDMAVVDSIPYLYFLQYKTYKVLQREADKQNALKMLSDTIKSEPNLAHKETALNLLGQCYEHESRPNDAFKCYVGSIQLRERNNAANFHICRLLAEEVGKIKSQR